MIRQSAEDDGVANIRRPIPEEPTEALPGTEEKIQVFQRRASKGQWLFHPEDARTDEE